MVKTTNPREKGGQFVAGFPKINAYPNLFVLDANGELLRSHDTEESERGEGCDDQRFMDFLNE